MISRSPPRYLWPDDHQRKGLPFNDAKHVYPEGPVRYVLTNMADPLGDLAGCRVLTFAAQGRFTYSTLVGAEAALKLWEPQLRAKVLGARADTLRVTAVECWPVHFDPKRTVFLEEQ